MKRALMGFLAAVALCLGGPASAQTTTRLSIGTGGTGGVYYPLGGGMAAILSKHVPGWEATAEVTGASVANLQLIGQGKQDFGFTMSDSAYDATKGDGKFKGHPVDARTLMVLYPNKMHVVTVQGNGINSVTDLKGKRISVGAAKSGTELNARAIFKAAGLAYTDMAKVEYLPFGESVELMKNRQLDATLISAGLGVAAIRDLGCAGAIIGRALYDGRLTLADALAIASNRAEPPT